MASEQREWKKGQIVGYAPPPVTECPILQGDPAWHIVLTAPNSEIRVKEGLNAAGFRSYNPVIRKFAASPTERHPNGQKKMVPVSRAMFPGYVFADIRAGIHNFADPLAVKGVRNYLLFHGLPCVLPAALVEAMREREKAEDTIFEEKLRGRYRAPFAVGEGVVISDGPFRGFFAQVNRLDDKGRVELLLDLFASKRKTWLKGNQLERA